MEKVNDAKNDGATKRRSRLDIIAEILDAATNGAVKTRIMYKANVNLIQYNEYAKCLLEARLIRAIRRGEKTIYKTTEKGKLLLSRFNETEEMFNDGNNNDGDRPLIVKKGPMIYLVKR